MIKRKTRFIFGLIIILALHGIPTPQIMAQDSPPPAPPDSRAVNACLNSDADFREEKPFGTFDSITSKGNFISVLEKAQEKYHRYINCIFEQVVAEILASPGIETDGFISGNTPNIPEWMRPNIACLDANQINQLATSTSTSAILPSLLKANNAYADHLHALHNNFKGNTTSSQSRREMEILMVNEIQDSLVALHTAFAMLNEMRQVLIMHVHFQCILRDLEDYRVLLSKIRSVITLLPARIIDASMTK